MFGIGEIFDTEVFRFRYEFLYEDSDLWEGLVEGIGFEEVFDMLEMFFHGGDIFLFELFL